MERSRYLLFVLLALVPGTLLSQDRVKPITPVPPLTDPNKKPDAVNPVPKTPSPALAKADTGAPGVYYSGNFDGNELGKEWKLVNPDPDRWTMQPKRKSVMLMTQKGACPSTKDAKNLLILDKELPREDFEVIVKASARFQGPGNRLAVFLFNDESNYFWAVLQGDGYNNRHNVYFQKIFQGHQTGSFVADLGYANDIYLKIDRDGNEYGGYYAVIDPAKPVAASDVQWITLGTLPWIRFQGKLVLCAENYADATEASAEFYSVLIRKK